MSRYLATRQFPRRRYCWMCGRWVGTWVAGRFEPRPRFGRHGRSGRYYCKDHA